MYLSFITPQVVVAGERSPRNVHYDIRVTGKASETMRREYHRLVPSQLSKPREQI